MLGVWAHIGTIAIISKSGVINGPPADNEYAVDPTGVETIIPSPLNEV